MDKLIKKRITIIGLVLLVMCWAGVAWGATLQSQIIRPSSDVVENWTIVGGTDTYDVLSDQDDSTYIYTEGTHEQYARVHMANPTVTGNVCGVRIWVKHSRTSNNYGTARLMGKTATNSNVYMIYSRDSYEYSYFDAPVNWDDSAAWAYADVDSLQILLNVNSTDGSDRGLKVTEVWAEIIYDTDAVEPYLSAGPWFGGVTTSAIEVAARGTDDCNIKFRYGTVEADVLTNTGDTATTAGEDVTTTTDWVSIQSISGLSVNTKYYVDVLVDDESMGTFEQTTASNPFWTTLPNCTTAPTADTDATFTAALITDIHGHKLKLRDMYANVSNESPALIVSLGDLHDNDPTSRTDQHYKSWTEQGYRGKFGYQLPSQYLQEYLWHDTPLFYTWSDHDFGLGNGTKIGDGNYGEAITANRQDLCLLGTTDYIPFPTLDAPSDVSGTADAGGDTDTLVDATVDFTDTVYPGMVVWNTADGEYAIIESITDANNIETTTLSGAASWDAGDTYTIRKGGIWHDFKWGNVEFFMVDLRSKRDPSQTPGGDFLDGTCYGTTAKYDATTDGTIASGLVDSSENFTAGTVVRIGDVVYNDTDNTYALVNDLTNAATGTLGLDSDIMISGEDYRILESGGSEHGNKANNETAGHIQREWLIDAVNNSTAKWKIICAGESFKNDDQSYETPCHYDPLDACYDYLQANINVPNVIWVGGDRHFAALDDATSAGDKWPNVSAGTLGGGMQANSMVWEVDGVNTIYGTQGAEQYSWILLSVSGDNITFSVVDAEDGTVQSTMTFTSGQFYIDSVNGSDNYLGVKSSQPWATFDKSGDYDSYYGYPEIYLARGSTFTDNPAAIPLSGSAGDRVIIDATGSGAPPIFQYKFDFSTNSYVTVQHVYYKNQVSLNGSNNILQSSVLSREQGSGINLIFAGGGAGANKAQNLVIRLGTIGVDANTNNHNLTNCIIRDTTTSDIDIAAGVTITGLNNFIEDAAVAGAGTYSDVGVTTTWLAGDPLFIDALAGNFNLRPSSPCINAGTKAGDAGLAGFQTNINDSTYYFTPYDRMNIGVDQAGSDADARPVGVGRIISGILR